MTDFDAIDNRPVDPGELVLVTAGKLAELEREATLGVLVKTLPVGWRLHRWRFVSGSSGGFSYWYVTSNIGEYRAETPEAAIRAALVAEHLVPQEPKGDHAS